VVTLIGGENRNLKVNDAVSTKNKLEFIAGPPINPSITKTYVTNVDLTLMRSSNVDNYAIYINGTQVFEPVMVKPNDTVTVWVTKANIAKSAWITFQETIVR
jgi:hypothetical protein